MADNIIDNFNKSVFDYAANATGANTNAGLYGEWMNPITKELRSGAKPTGWVAANTPFAEFPTTPTPTGSSVGASTEKIAPPADTDINAGAMNQEQVNVGGGGGTGQISAPPTGETENMAEGESEYQKSLQEKIDTTSPEIASKRAEVERLYEEYQNNPTPDTLGLIKQYEEELGTSEKQRELDGYMVQIGDIQEGIAKLTADRDAATSGLEVRGGISMFTLTGRQAAIEKFYNSRIASKTAELIPLQMKIDIAQGNIEQANAKIDKYVQAVTYDYKVDSERTWNFLNYNKDLLTEMGKEYTTAVENLAKEKDKIYEEKKQEAKDIMNLQLDAMNKYGVSLNLTGLSYEDAVSAYQRGVAPVAGAMVAKSLSTTDTGSEMNARQVAIFNSLVDKQNKSPLVAANDRAVILKSVTESLANDPKNAALQVSFIYSMIQALDTYQSAVREGEIGLVSGTQGLGEKIMNLPSKIEKGNPLAESKIKEYITTANLLINSIGSAAQQKRNAFSEQARIAGIGDAFSEYQQSVYGGSGTTTGAVDTSLRETVINKGYDYDALRADYSDAEIKEAFGIQ